MFIITAKRWVQKSCGNTYHSVTVEQVKDDKIELIGRVPFAYGYGSHYMQTAAEIIGNDDIYKKPELYHITVIDVNRKKDL